MVADAVVYHPTVAHYLRFVATTVGRDKLLRTLQYFSRFYAWYLYRTNHPARIIAPFEAIKKQFGLTRKALRVGKNVEHFKAAAVAADAKGMDPILKYLAVGRQMGYASYLSLDAITYLDAAGIRPIASAKRLQQEAYKAWFAGLICNALAGFYTLYQLRQRESVIDKNDGEGVVESKNIIKERNTTNLQLVSDLCDLCVPSSALGYVNLDEGIVGLAGTISSLIGVSSARGRVNMEDAPNAPGSTNLNPHAVADAEDETVQATNDGSDGRMTEKVNDSINHESCESVEWHQHKDLSRDSKPQNGRLAPTDSLTKAASKPPLLIRPPSPHEDLTSGFLFTKRKSSRLSLSNRAKNTNTPGLFEQYQDPDAELHANACVPAKIQEDDQSLGDLKLIADSIRGNDRQNASRQNATSRELEHDCHNVELAQSYQKKRSSSGDKHDAKTTSWTNAEEDAIHMLMSNREKLLRHCDSLLVTNKVQEEKIADLKEIESRLQAKLQDAYRLLEVRDTEIQALKPKLQARLRRFKDYLNSLCNEHVQLKDIGRRIFEVAHEARSEHQETKADLDQTRSALNSREEAIRHERKSWMTELTGLDYKIKLSEQTCLNLREQLHQARIVSSNENARKESVERIIEQRRSEHEYLMGIYATNLNELARNFVHLLDKTSQLPTPDQGDNNSIPTLNRCIGLLESLQTKESLGPADLHKLQTSVNEDAKLVLSSMKTCESTIIANVALSQQMAGQIDVSVNKQLQEMARIMVKDQQYREQVLGCREQQACAQKKLEATEASLSEIRMESAVLRTREEGNFQKIASLEAEVSKLRSESAIAVEASLRLRDLETLNQKLDQQNSNFQIGVSALSAQLKQKESYIDSINNQLVTTQLQLEETKAKNIILHEEMSSYQEQVAGQQEQSKNELTRAAHAQLNLESKLEQTKEALRISQADMAKLSHTSVKEIEKLTLDKELAEKALSDNSRYSEITQKELQKEREVNLSLEARIKQESSENKARQKAKDDEIAKLRAVMKKSRNCIPKPLNYPDLDSHHADNPPDDDDSQVEEIPRNLTEIMNETHRTWSPRPIRSCPKVSSPKTVTSETVAGLFPRAPGPPNEVETSQNQTLHKSRSIMRRATAEVADSQSQRRDNRQSMEHDLEGQNLSMMSPLSPSAASTTQIDISLDDITARNTATNVLGAKSNTKAPRKRNAMVADLAGPYEAYQPKKTTRSSARIHDSDSRFPTPASSQTIRPLKMNTTNKKGKVGMYQKKFAQYN